MCAHLAERLRLGGLDNAETIPMGVERGIFSPRLRSSDVRATALESVIFAGTSADVRDVVISGRDVVRDGRHLLVPDVPGALTAAIRAVLS